jgi:hypothetical protein
VRKRENFHLPIRRKHEDILQGWVPMAHAHDPSYLGG